MQSAVRIQDNLLPDGNEQHPLCRAFRRFHQGLDPNEKSEYTDVSFLDILVSVRGLDASLASSSKSRSLISRIDPFLRFLDRHAKALDSMVQVYPNPSALIWGFVRVVLDSARSFIQYFEKMTSMIEKLSDAFSRYQEYEILLGGNQRFEEALGLIYYDVLIFLKKAKKLFTARGSKTLCKSPWKNFETDFQQVLGAVARHQDSLEAEITLAHRIEVRKCFEQQSAEQKIARECLSRVECFAELCGHDASHARSSIMKWLSPIDMEEFRCRVSRCRAQASGGWLIRHHTFQEWLGSQHRAFWVCGSPGSGKTVLSTVVIDDLRHRVGHRPKHACAFFFCDKSDENNQSTIHILGTIIAQILAQMQDVPNYVQAAYATAIRYGRQGLSMSDQPTLILKHLALSLERLYIVIDGLDENKEAATLLESVDYLVRNSTSTHFILLSRKMPKVKGQLRDFYRLELGPDLVSVDINDHIHDGLSDLAVDDPDTLDHIFERLSHAANGSFLWSSLMMKSLKLATSPHEISEILSDIPIGLDKTYTSIVNKIAQETPRRRAVVRKTLHAICCSARPLRWSELQTILAFESSHACFMDSLKPFKSAILELEGSLFEYTPATDQFRLTHMSVREFLLSSPDDHGIEEKAKSLFLEEAEGQLHLSEICLAYQSRYDSETPSDKGPGLNPLLEYSTLFWCHHACQSRYSRELKGRINDFLARTIACQSWILRFLDWQPSTFPLQYLMKLQNSLSEWLAQSSDLCVDVDLLDWIQYIPQILLFDEAPTSSNPDGNNHNDVSSPNGLQRRISHFEKLMVMRDLSREYTMRNTLENGERWLTEALETRRRRHGCAHISTAWLLNSLGIIYDQQHRVSLSARTQEAALAIQSSVLGPDHFETIWTVNELGRMYRHSDDLAQSESMHQRALAVLRSVLHPHDLQIAWTINTLGRTYRKQRRFDEAIVLLDQALEIRNSVLGKMHPHTLWTTMDKAACYLEQGRLLESVDLYGLALEGRETVLGRKHADTFWAMNNLARALERVGQIQAAIDLHGRAFQGQAELLGSDHPHTVWSREAREKLNGGVDRKVKCEGDARMGRKDDFRPDG